MSLLLYLFKAREEKQRTVDTMRLEVKSSASGKFSGGSGFSKAYRQDKRRHES